MSRITAWGEGNQLSITCEELTRTISSIGKKNVEFHPCLYKHFCLHLFVSDVRITFRLIGEQKNDLKMKAVFC